MNAAAEHLSAELEHAEHVALEAIRRIAELGPTCADRIEALLCSASLTKIIAIAANNRERVLREHPYQPPAFQPLPLPPRRRKRAKFEDEEEDDFGDD